MFDYIKFRNFRSYYDENQLTMVASKKIRGRPKDATLQFKKERFIKSALLFGANASGKTNVIYAFAEMVKLLNQPTELAGTPLPTAAFGNNKENTMFEFGFMKDKVAFEYHIEYNEQEVVEEWLKADGQLVFSRKGQSYPVMPDQLQVIEPNIRKNQLLLFVAQANNVELASVATAWFLEDIDFITPETGINKADFKLLKKPMIKNKFVQILQAADFNILDVFVKVKGEHDHHLEQGQIDVTLQHEDKDKKCFNLDFEDESRGTKAWMFAIMAILSANESKQNKLILIDEFDSSFHFELAKVFLSILDERNQNNQLLLTTHDLSLLDNNLSQDKIWFTENDGDGYSKLFSLDDFDDPRLRRKDAGIRKRYLEGQLGATPIINTAVIKEAFG
ncbi:ATP-binding protein [Fructobacillus sp. M2-14]|uniref:ATP-binding protein n=1 Tax=Fructobacillus broussonetiae TaxID=2713173 RepID=A0ABS5R0P1_9LACO|nr:ATP-binding protein [Fructobacillus broussonetiae]MBS9339008.1 ATP-binding protein [Fructobacillus broussonetiae]